MLRNSLALPALLGLLLLSGTGCAFVNLTVRPLPVPELNPREGSSGPPVVVVVPFTDSRPQKGRCGMQKNGYNLDTASVYCAADPATYLAEHLAAELRLAGFAVQRAADPASPAALRIEGQLLQFFVEPEIGFVTVTPEADIHIRLVVTSPSGLEAERDFYVKDSDPGLVALEPMFQTAADKATRRITLSMGLAVQSLFKRFPQLRYPAGAPTDGPL
jgi:hypothetical protein